MILPERMKRGHYLVKGERIARKILRVKRHPEYDEERLYVLEGEYGNELPPYEAELLIEQGFTKYVSPKELETMFRQGKYLPSKGRLTTRTEAVQCPK